MSNHFRGDMIVVDGGGALKSR
ncbi:hypothetical protein L195_g035033, partial [Trifolium pratense]